MNLVDGCQLSLDEGAVDEVGKLEDFYCPRSHDVASPNTNEGIKEYFLKEGCLGIPADLRHDLALVEPPAIRRLGKEIESGDVKIMFREDLIKRKVAFLLSLNQPTAQAAPEVEVQRMSKELGGRHDAGVTKSRLARFRLP